MSWSFSQNNDECFNAVTLSNPANYCSSATQFSNVAAQASTLDDPVCFQGENLDVWFQFQPVASDVNITITGLSKNGGTLVNPQVALYFGYCNAVSIQQLECGVAPTGTHVVEIYQGALFIGQTYFIRVSGVNGSQGSFQLCINNYFSPKLPGSDCATASILCDKSTFSVESVTGAGRDNTELDQAPCFVGGIGGQGYESNSTWFKWVCQTSGSLTFSITPSKFDDDLDFVLFEMTNGINDCDAKEIIRCEAAGEDPALYPTPCHGPTGLDSTARDISEPPGCSQGQDNFIAPINMEAGKAYLLAINNYTSTGNGFTIEFGGTGVFVGPDINFTIDPSSGLKCEQEFSITDNSTFEFGTIEKFSWAFGEDAIPATSSTKGPHGVNYASFGSKVISLQLETDRGCVVAKTAEIYVDPCCEDLPNIAINEEIKDLTCAGVPTGGISLTSSGGTLWYKYALEDGDFSFNDRFIGLDAGNYLVNVVDARGCEAMKNVIIREPEPLMVNAGEDILADLGYEVEFYAQYTPTFANIISSWISSNGDSIICLDPPECLSVQVLPPGSTDYIITIVDEAGCTDSDTVSARVAINRKVFYPNVFSPNNDGINDMFSFKANRSATVIEVFRVFDRWGGMVFEARDLPLNDQNMGWDGRYKGEFMPIGVYTFVALIRFVDRQVIPFSGDITIVR